MGLKAGNADLILSINVGENSVFALYHKLIKAIQYSSKVEVKLTGGTSLGISTSLANFLCPSRGQVRSVLPSISSHRSASTFTNRIKPYLTWRWILDPCSTASWNMPSASMVRISPLWSTMYISKTFIRLP